MIRLKKILSTALAISMFATINTNVFASEQPYLQTTDTLGRELNVTFNVELGENIDLINDTLARSVENYNQSESQVPSVVFDIRMPKVFTVSQQEAKTYGENHFENKINALSELYDIAADIDDADFQSIAKEYALQDASYTELAEYIDIYENYEYNTEMEKLMASVETTQYATTDQLFSDENFNSLLSMMPVDENANPATIEGNVATSTFSAKSLSGYSGANARAYAKTWALKTNNSSYGYYADYFKHPAPNNNNMWSGGKGNDKRTWNDCANFVSQCLNAGGASTIKSGLILPHQDNDNWYYSNSKPSNSWGGASNFQKHWTARVGVRSSSADAKVGDPVSLDNGGDGIADHTVIITTVNGTNSNQMLYAGHTSDQFETSGKSLATLYDNYKKIWIYSVA